MDLAKWIDTTFKSLGWRDLIIGFVVVAVSLLAVGRVVGNAYRDIDEQQSWSKLTETPNFFVRTRGRDDPKSYLPIPQRIAEDERFVIAWVVGSGANIMDAPPQWQYKGAKDYRLSEVLADQLKYIDGRPVRVDVLAQKAASALDVRRNLLYALKNPDIDAVIVTINEFVAFNDWRVITRSDRSAILDAPLVEPIDWLALIATAAPADVFMRLAHRAVGFYDTRRELSDQFYNSKASSFPSEPSSSVGSEDPLRYWQTLFFSELKASKLAWLAMSNAKMDGFGAKIFAANLRSASASNKPVIFYMTPAREDIKTRPMSRRILDRQIRLIEWLATRYGGENVVVAGWSALSAPQPYAHRDEYHLRHGQGVVDMLVKLLQDAGLQIEIHDISPNYGSGENANSEDEDNRKTWITKSNKTPDKQDAL